MDSMALKLGGLMLPIPGPVWRHKVRREARKTIPKLLDFMSPDHHRVRNLAVTALGETGEPLTAAAIGDRLGLPRDRVVELVDELEARQFFLYRGAGGAVTWAYPVTVDETPHHLAFETGERMTAA